MENCRTAAREAGRGRDIGAAQYDKIFTLSVGADDSAALFMPLHTGIVGREKVNCRAIS